MSAMDPAAFSTLSDGYIAAAGDTVPSTPADGRRLLRVVHDVDHALDDLHGLCDAKPDLSGRCIECGRLIGWPSPRLAHKSGGCLMAIPFVGSALWVRHNYMSIPFVGKALWMFRHRGGRS